MDLELLTDVVGAAIADLREEMRPLSSQELDSINRIVTGVRMLTGQRPGRAAALAFAAQLLTEAGAESALKALRAQRRAVETAQ
jgi:hypothetical protein